MHSSKFSKIFFCFFFYSKIIDIWINTELDSQARGKRATCATPRTCTSVSRRDAWGRTRVNWPRGCRATCREDTRVACYWSWQKGDALRCLPHTCHFPLYIYVIVVSFFARIYNAGILKWNKLEICRGEGCERAFSLHARATNPSLPALPYRKRGCEGAKGASRVSITTIAVLTHLSLSFIAQFDIKRQRYTVVHEPERRRGRFFNRLHSATKCRARRISRVGLIEGKSIVQIQIDPFVTHFSATGFVPTT